MAMAPGKPDTGPAPGKKTARQRTFRSRIMLLGILAGLLPLIAIGFTVQVISQSLPPEMDQSWYDLKTQEGGSLEEKVQALIHSHLRQKALEAAENVSQFLRLYPQIPLAALLTKPELRDLAVQPLGMMGETFLVEAPSKKILLHRQEAFAGQALESLLPPAPEQKGTLAAASLPDLNLTAGHEEASKLQIILVPVPHSVAGGHQLLVGITPQQAGLAHVLTRTRAAFHAALNQSRALSQSRLLQLQRHLILLLAFFSLVGLIISLTLIRRLARDVAGLRRAAEAYNAGDLDYRIPDPDNDELGQLAQTLHRMAASLKENTISRQEWETTFDNIPDLIMIMDEEQRLTRLNRAAAHLLGVSPEEAVGRHFGDLLAGSSWSSHFQGFFRANPRPSDGREEFQWEDQGRTFLGTLTLLHSLEGRFIGAVFVSRDITVVKQMQRELAQTSHFLNQIIEAAPLALTVVNQKGLFTHVNPQVLVEYGYSPEDLLDRQYSVVYADQSEMLQVLGELNKRGEILNRQVEFLHKNGHRVPARLSIRKLYGEGGELLGSVALSSDISEEISLQRQLEAAQRQEAIATLAAGLAHNFNNLLMVIIGLTTLMLSKVSPDHPFYADLKEIERQVRSGREITRKLLSFRQGLGDETRPIDLNNLVEFTADMFARTKSDLTIAKDLDPQLPAAEVDPGQVQQVLMNLLINAWQAMPQGGEISIRTRSVRVDGWNDGHFHLAAGAYICLSVSDTGEGMDEETLAHLFEPFFTTKGPGQGSGLGLASAYRIIKNHHGAIQVHSEKGKGARFDLYLPASSLPPQVLAPREDLVITGQGTILVVDDEPLLRRIARKLLQKLGYRVLEAASGQSALEIFQERGVEINLVLLDLIMPGLNGYQTLERLRALNPEVPVLMCSGYGDGAEEELPPGVKFLSKPYPLEILSQRVSEALSGPRA